MSELKHTLPKLTAELVAYSSVVGRSVTFNNDAGACVSLVMISVPNPQFDYRETSEPIAHLIAAAPDMFAALQALAGPMEAVRDDQASQGLHLGSTPAARAERARLLIDWIKANADRVDDALELAFAAIDKAEGRSP